VLLKKGHLLQSKNNDGHKVTRFLGVGKKRSKDDILGKGDKGELKWPPLKAVAEPIVTKTGIARPELV